MKLQRPPEHNLLSPYGAPFRAVATGAEVSLICTPRTLHQRAADPKHSTIAELSWLCHSVGISAVAV